MEENGVEGAVHRCQRMAVGDKGGMDAGVDHIAVALGDGKLPTGKDTDNLFALNDDFTISYTGIAAHMMFGSRMKNVYWVDYGKYVSGERDFRVKKEN